MRTKKIDGVTYIHREDYQKSPGIVVDHILIDHEMMEIVANMRMSASRRKSLNRKLKRRRLTERWIPALYEEKAKEVK
ncbi:MAG: hypothetical protein GY774_16730 [Planctomycetes bacterium]|nr:hypothetical protein [Planctomycetota bacterium]